MREIALKIWSEYNANKDKGRKYLKDLIQEEVKKSYLTNREKAFISEILYGVCRNRLYLEHIVSLSIKRKKKALLPFLLFGGYQILFMNSVPDYAAVSEMTNLAKKKGFKRQSGFINAVLRNIARKKEEFISMRENVEKSNIRKVSIFLSYPYWYVEKVYEQYGEDEGFNILNAMNNPYNFKGRIRKISINGKEREFFISENQEKAVNEINVRKNSCLLDVCSCPGTKSLLVLSKCNDVKLVCCDINFKKLLKQKLYFDDLNLKNVSFLCLDASNYSPKKSVSFFDGVFVDVPCSNSGEMSRRPEVRWRLRCEDIDRLVLLQKSILNNSLMFVEKDGVLIYSTCSIFQEENELLIKGVLQKKKEFVLIKEKKFIPKKEIPSGGYFAVIKRRT